MKLVETVQRSLTRLRSKMKNRFWAPSVGEIYRFSRGERTFEILVQKVHQGRVYFITLGLGRARSMGIYEFKAVSYFVEHRIQRLRRACQQYGLKETDKWIQENLSR